MIVSLGRKRHRQRLVFLSVFQAAVRLFLELNVLQVTTHEVIHRVGYAQRRPALPSGSGV